MPTDMKQDCGEVKQESGGVAIPTWLFWIVCVNAVICLANLFYDLIKGNGDRGAAAETVYVVEKREGDGGEYEKGGIVVCFGCRGVYYREPIWAVWHTEFCPRCCKDGDARWDEDNILLWKQLEKTLRKDVRKDDGWVAVSSVGVKAANWEQTVKEFQTNATAMSGKQTKGM